MTNWPLVKIADFAEVIGGGTPSKKNASYFGGEIPWITPKDLSGYLYKHISGGATYLTKDGLNKSSAKLLPINTVLFSSRAPIGYIALAKTPLTTNQGFRSLVCDQGMAMPNYIYYSLKFYSSAIESIASGATFKEISGSVLGNFKIPLPPLDNQKKIAAIFSAYDDLIENNLRRIKILEEMAQNHYCEWFVNFRFPGHEQTRFVDSPLGRIPEGWVVKGLIDFGEIITGKTPSKIRLDYYGDDVPFIKLPDMHNNIYCTQTIDNLSKSGADSQKSKTLPPNSLCVSCIGTVGKVAITTFKSQTNQQINSIIPYRRDNLEFLFFSLLGLKEKIELYSATGATMNNLSRGKFISLRVMYPSENLIKEYHDLVSPNFRAILNLQLKNEMLKKTRDLLLPKLISGEVDVSDLDIKVPEEVIV